MSFKVYLIIVGCDGGKQSKVYGIMEENNINFTNITWWFFDRFNTNIQIDTWKNVAGFSENMVFHLKFLSGFAFGYTELVWAIRIIEIILLNRSVPISGNNKVCFVRFFIEKRYWIMYSLQKITLYKNKLLDITFKR